MKTKTLIALLGICTFFLICFSISYKILNKYIEKNINNSIANYVNIECKECNYKFLKATHKDQYSFCALIETQKNYHKDTYKLFFSYDYSFIKALKYK